MSFAPLSYAPCHSITFIGGDGGDPDPARLGHRNPTPKPTHGWVNKGRFDYALTEGASAAARSSGKL